MSELLTNISWFSFVPEGSETSSNESTSHPHYSDTASASPYLNVVFGNSSVSVLASDRLSVNMLLYLLLHLLFSLSSYLANANGEAVLTCPKSTTVQYAKGTTDPVTCSSTSYCIAGHICSTYAKPPASGICCKLPHNIALVKSERRHKDPRKHHRGHLPNQHSHHDHEHKANNQQQPQQNQQQQQHTANEHHVEKKEAPKQNLMRDPEIQTRQFQPQPMQQIQQLIPQLIPQLQQNPASFRQLPLAVQQQILPLLPVQLQQLLNQQPGQGFPGGFQPNQQNFQQGFPANPQLGGFPPNQFGQQQQQQQPASLQQLLQQQGLVPGQPSLSQQQPNRLQCPGLQIPYFQIGSLYPLQCSGTSTTPAHACPLYYRCTPSANVPTQSLCCLDAAAAGIGLG